MLNNVIVKSIEQSQSLKDNPKLFLISTDGFVFDGFWDEELKTGRKAIYREDYTQASKRRLDWYYTQDSELEIWTNRNSWQKSNPTLGIVKKWDYLDEQVELAKNSKADRIFVLSKDFNIKQNGVESWLNVEDYSYTAVYDIEDFRGAVCLGLGFPRRQRHWFPRFFRSVSPRSCRSISTCSRDLFRHSYSLFLRWSISQGLVRLPQRSRKREKTNKRVSFAQFSMT